MLSKGLIDLDPTYKLDQEVLQIVWISIGWLGPFMFGALWDWSGKRIRIKVRLLCFLGGIIYAIGTGIERAGFLFIGYSLVALTTYTLFSMPISLLVI